MLDVTPVVHWVHVEVAVSPSSPPSAMMGPGIPSSGIRVPATTGSTPTWGGRRSASVGSSCAKAVEPCLQKKQTIHINKTLLWIWNRLLKLRPSAPLLPNLTSSFTKARDLSLSFSFFSASPFALKRNHLQWGVLGQQLMQNLCREPRLWFKLLLLPF